MDRHKLDEAQARYESEFRDLGERRRTATTEEARLNLGKAMYPVARELQAIREAKDPNFGKREPVGQLKRGDVVVVDTTLGERTVRIQGQDPHDPEKGGAHTIWGDLVSSTDPYDDYMAGNRREGVWAYKQQVVRRAERKRKGGRKTETIYVGEHPTGAWVEGYWTKSGWHTMKKRRGYREGGSADRVR